MPVGKLPSSFRVCIRLRRAREAYSPIVNKSNKGRPIPGHPGAVRGSPIDHVIPEDELERLSTLQLVDIISHKLVMQGALPSDMSLLRRRVEEMEEMQDEARTRWRSSAKPWTSFARPRCGWDSGFKSWQRAARWCA